MPPVLPISKPATATPPRRSAGRALMALALFGLGLFGTAAVIDRFLPMLPVPLVKDKVNWLAEHGDEYDTFFIGSSRTLCHIIPERFDQLMAEAGTPTRSFNLGVFGMRSPEDTYLLETFLAHRRTPLKLVIAEANPIALKTEDGVHGTLRAVYWHDLRRTGSVCRAILESKSEGGFFEKLTALQYNASLFFTKTLSIGRGREQLERVLVPQPSTLSQSIGPRRDGSALDDTATRVIDEAGWQLLQKNLGKPPRPDHRNRASQDELTAKRRLVEAQGGRLVVFAPPLTGKVFVSDPKLHPGLPCFNFSEPARYPEFYFKENRFDEGHLNYQGAEQFTARLVERLTEWQKAER